MDNKDFSNLGEQIRSSVQDAINSMDFRQLNKTISDSVNCAIDEARNRMLKGIDAAEEAVDAHKQKRAGGGFRTDGDKRTSYGDCKYATDKRAGQTDAPGYRPFQTSKTPPSDSKTLRLNKTGRISGVLCLVLGATGLGMVAIMLLVTWILALVAKPLWGAVLAVCVILLALACVFGTMIWRGIAIGGRLKRAELYLKRAGSRLYCNIEELSGNIGKTERFVIKDLQRMIEKGILPEAHIDEQKTCLMLDEETYKQYLSAQSSLKQREKDRAKSPEDFDASSPGAKAAEEAGALPEGLREMMAQGREYLSILREANEGIPGKAISGKITRLENVIKRIFDTVERKPADMEELGRFMDYYLPTTVKLVTAYRDFERIEFEGDNIVGAKHEIEKTLDTINMAFERLLDDLYQDAAFDVTTDASVLQTMLKRDGFAGSDFDGREES